MFLSDLTSSFNDAVVDAIFTSAVKAPSQSMSESFRGAAAQNPDPPKRLLIRDLKLSKKEVIRILKREDPKLAKASDKKLDKLYEREKTRVRNDHKFETRLIEALKSSDAQVFEKTMQDIENEYPNTILVFDAARYNEKTYQRETRVLPHATLEGLDFAKPDREYVDLMSSKSVFKACRLNVSAFKLSNTLSPEAMERQAAVMNDVLFVNSTFTAISPEVSAESDLFTDIRSIPRRERGAYDASLSSVGNHQIVAVSALMKDHNLKNSPATISDYRDIPFFSNMNCDLVDAMIVGDVSDEVFSPVNFEFSDSPGHQEKLIAEYNPIGTKDSNNTQGQVTRGKVENENNCKKARENAKKTGDSRNVKSSNTPKFKN